MERLLLSEEWWNLQLARRPHHRSFFPSMVTQHVAMAIAERDAEKV